MKPPHTIKKRRLADQSIVISGRVFGLTAAISIAFGSVIVIYACLWFHAYWLIPVLVAFVAAQPFINHYSIHMSSERVVIRFKYLGITITKLDVPLEQLVINHDIGTQAEQEDIMVVDFWGDLDTDCRYVTVSYRKKQYVFSTDFLKRSDQKDFEEALWNEITSSYNEICEAAQTNKK